MHALDTNKSYIQTKIQKNNKFKRRRKTDNKTDEIFERRRIMGKEKEERDDERTDMSIDCNLYI